MEISFKGPVMPIDPYSQLAFVEILNIILIAKHIMDVNRYLIARNVNPLFGSLSGYFRWSFAELRVYIPCYEILVHIHNVLCYEYDVEYLHKC